MRQPDIVNRYRRSLHSEFLADLRGTALLAIGPDVPWRVHPDMQSVVESYVDEEPEVCRQPKKPWRAGWPERADFIALAHPALVVALVDELAALRALTPGPSPTAEVEGSDESVASTVDPNGMGS